MTDREIKTQWLGRGRPLRLRLIGLYAERAERRSRAEYAGIRYDGTGGASGNATERRLDALAVTEAEIMSVERELATVEAEIRAAIEQVHRPLFQTYLRMRFLGYRTEPQIAAETGYSLEHIHGYIRRGALDSVQFSKINPK